MASVQVRVLKYTMLPGLLPRMKEVFDSGFTYVAYFVAVIYAAVGLLPADHPYLNPQNSGKFGIRHVIAQAASRLVFSRNHIDQIAVFSLILIGMVLLVLQFVLLLLSFLAQPAMAQSFSQVFGVSPLALYEAGAQDIVFIAMDRIFGMTGIFNSCISTAADCIDRQGNVIAAGGAYPYPMHRALHTLLEFYTRGIFVVSVFVILYLITTIVAETAATGTPFGQRFNRLWAPVRLVLFFALLVPMNTGASDSGANSAQIIALWVAKSGSNFATNTWLLFNDRLTGTYLGDTRDLVAKPKIPELSELVKFMYVAKTCKIAKEMAYPGLTGGKIQAYVVREKQYPAVAGGADATAFLPAGFNQAARFSNYGNIKIVFGHLDTTLNEKFKGGVRPYCGDITVKISQMDSLGAPYSGANAIQSLYYNLIKEMWQNPGITDYAECSVRHVVQDGMNPNCPFKADADFAQSQMQLYKSYLENNLGPLIDRQIASTDWSVQGPILRLGWAGSALWYNRIAEVNGEVSTAVLNIPQAGQYPEIMTLVAEKKKMQDENAGGASLYDPILASGQPMDFENPVDLQVATALYKAHAFWDQDGVAHTHFTSKDSNFLISIINKVFGTSGIYDILENPDIHPLAQLSALGRSMTEASINNIFLGAAGNLVVGSNQAGAAIAGLMNTIGFSFLAMALILYYILPLMPFIYFLFAVSGWVKGVFEAVIGMPLWALAHILSIDGQGLPGRFATGGYFLLMEIFIRPTLIVIGMLASIIVFSGLVVVMNDVFNIAVMNVGGFDRENASALSVEYYRGPLDQFFFTAMYVVAVYMLALSCFKLIDQIPKNVMRWMGASVASFQESNTNAASELTQKAYSSVQMSTGQIRGGTLAFLLR